MSRLSQDQKHRRGLAGEFLVAGELLRRDIIATVTYGNAKKADVIALDGERAVVIEVKTTSQEKWVLGNSLPDPTDRLWVLVYLPVSGGPPTYYIATGRDLNALLLPQDQAYRAKFRALNKRDFTATGVVSIRRDQLSECEAAWHKVTRRL